VSDDRSSDRLDARTVGIVAGLFVLTASAAAYEIAPASVTPLIRESFGIGPSAAGWVVSVMFATAVAVSLPVGVVLDRVNVRIAVLVATLGLLASGVWGWAAASATAYWWLLVSRVLGAFAFVVVWNAGPNVIARTVPPSRRATVVGVFTASGPFGFALGQFGAPLVASVGGWPAIFPAFAAVSLPGIALFLVATAGGDVTIETDVPTGSEMWNLATNPAVWTLCGLGFLAYAVYLFLNGWLPSYLTTELGVSLTVGGALAALFPLVGVVSRTGGGYVSDRLFGGRRRPVLLVAFLVSGVAVAGFVVFTQVAVVVGLVLTSGFAVQLAIGLLFAYVTEVVPPEVGTTAVAMLTSVGLFGAFLAPIGAGAIIERSGYRSAFLVAVVVVGVGIVLALWAPEPRTS
jgi:nitrate/nitrite transporter NarK